MQKEKLIMLASSYLTLILIPAYIGYSVAPKIVYLKMYNNTEQLKKYIKTDKSTLNYTISIQKMKLKFKTHNFVLNKIYFHITLNVFKKNVINNSLSETNIFSF